MDARNINLHLLQLPVRKESNFMRHVCYLHAVAWSVWARGFCITGLHMNEDGALSTASHYVILTTSCVLVARHYGRQ
jgi:hypothetical protein